MTKGARKGEKPKQTGGTPKKKLFSKTKNKENYVAYAKEITTFCKRPGNRGVGLSDLAKRACEKLGFNTKSFSAVKGYIHDKKLVSAAAKAAGNKPKEPANDLLATSGQEFRNEYGFSPTSDAAGNMAKIWGHRERAAERNPGRTGNDYAEWKSNYVAAKLADTNLDTVLQEYRKEKIKECNIKHGWTDGVKPAVDLAELEKPKELRSGSPVLAEPAPSRFAEAPRARWSTEEAAALAELVEQEETTPRQIKADEPTWERIATRLRAEVAGAEYTAKQCADKAYVMGLLATAEEKLPLFQPYFVGARPPLDLAGLRRNIKCGDAARPELAKLTVPALYYLCGFCFNVGVCALYRSGGKEALIDALATAGMPACDPNDFGAEVPRVATPAFRKALAASVVSHCCVERSVAAAERALGTPADARGGPVVGSKGYKALMRRKVLKHWRDTYRPPPGVFPPWSANAEVIANAVTVAYTPHTDFDPRQDCCVCGRLFLDCGGRVFCAERRRKSEVPST